MNDTAQVAIRGSIEAILTARGQGDPVADTASLLVSGSLDSLAATEVMMMLEAKYDLDLSDPDFDMPRLDTIADLKALVMDKAARRFQDSAFTTVG